MVRHDLRLSLEINFDASDLQVLPETSGRDFRYLDQLLDALADLVRDTSWPESRQGEFLGYVDAGRLRVRMRDSLGGRQRTDGPWRRRS